MNKKRKIKNFAMKNEQKRFFFPAILDKTDKKLKICERRTKNEIKYFFLGTTNTNSVKTEQK
jgi:hypothetical protein